ncbi:MAG: DUF4365 domain-containing protein, partial [Micrococcales bacterium]|nr:DUF4365 domain-containing protein [Micrococcales bacterium]
MPKRDRKHELETLSGRAFEKALPPWLVVRMLSEREYGIDREVEVFLEGQTTGLSFKVQLKGTDGSGKQRRVRRDSLTYWCSLDVPVLLVSWEAKTGVLRGRWAHSIGADGPDNGGKTLTVRLEPGIAIGDTWAARLANDLALIRVVKRGEVPKPTPVRVEISGVPVSADQVTATVLSLSRRTRHPMTAPADPDEAALTVVITSGQIQAALPLCVASCTLHQPKGDPLCDDERQVANLAMVTCALAVARVGNEDCARQWLLVVDPAAPVWVDPGLVAQLLSLIHHEDTASLILSIHAHLIETNSPNADIYASLLLDLVGSIGLEDFESYSTRVREHLSADLDGGRITFNLAHLHRLRKEYQTALSLLEQAADMESTYHDYHLWQRSRGECLWNLDRYDDAAQAYRLAVEQGADSHEILPLLADSLMYAGRYEAARRTLDEWQPRGCPADKAGVLRVAILDHLLSTVGIADQDRIMLDPYHPDEERCHLSESDPTDRATLLSFLRDADALHPLPWLALALPEDGTIDYQSALISALLLQHDESTWALTLVGGIKAGAEKALLSAITNQARWLCGESFFDTAQTLAESQDEEVGRNLRELINTIYSEEPETLEPHVRLNNSPTLVWTLDELAMAAWTDP